jgi:hypothetical protein
MNVYRVNSTRGSGFGARDSGCPVGTSIRRVPNPGSRIPTAELAKGPGNVLPNVGVLERLIGPIILENRSGGRLFGIPKGNGKITP